MLMAENLKSSSRALSSVSGNLLVVDDAPSILIILKSFLEGDRCRLFAAENGAKALQILEEEEIDLVLLDVMMPEMGGYEVCRQMRTQARTRDIPVIFLTGLGRKEEIIRGLEVGGSDYLIKPFDREELLLRVRHHLDAYANQRRLQRLSQEQRIFNLALNEELQRQVEAWEPLRRSLEEQGAAADPSLKARLTGLDKFFRNVRQWSDLLSGVDVTMRSPIHFSEEIDWDNWREPLKHKGLGWKLTGDEQAELFADIRMVNLMFGLLLPWIASIAESGSELHAQVTSSEKEVVVEISWQSSQEILDSVPDVHDLSWQEPGANLSEELPLRLAHLIMRRHYGELALTRDGADSARLSLMFPNT